MADSTTPSNDTRAVSGSSSFLRTVCLYDWWLTKAQNDFQGKRLAVAGVSSRKEEAVRVFVSAPITKRHDVFSLETADGIYVIIKGFINEQRTLENGFAPQVFNSFLFGFPPNWESYALDCLGEESNADIDPGNAAPDNVSAIRPEILSDGAEKSIPTSLVLPEEAPGNCEKPFPEDECNVSKEMGEVNVAYGSGRNRRSARLHNIKVCQQKKQPASGGAPKHPDKGQSSTSTALKNCDLDTAVPDSVSAIWPEISSDGVEKSIPTSLVSLEEAPGDREKPFLEDERNMSNKMGGVNISYGSGGSRRSARLHNTKACQQKHPASGGPLKHSDKEKSSTSMALENRDLDSAVPDSVSPIRPEISSDGVEKSIPTSLVSLEEAPGDREKPFLEDERNMSNEMGGVNIAYGSGGSRRSARLHNTKLCQQKHHASGGPLKHPDKEQSSTSMALENRDLDSAVPDSVSPIHPEISSDGVEKSIPISLVSLEEAPGDREKPFLEDEHKMSNEMGGVNVAYGSGRNRRRHSARLHNIKVCQQKKQPATGGPPRHPDKDKSSTSAALENRDGEGLECPLTPIQSQSKGPVNTLSEQLIKKFASRISRTLSPKTEGHYKKRRVTVKTEAVTPKRKTIKSASSVKSPQERGASHLNKGSKLKISSVSPESSSFKKSRSGRLLLPPLEFWRNQIPIYNADHGITEIQGGASLVSPCRGSSPSLGRS